MKSKRWILTYGTVVKPLNIGKRARYLHNGVLMTTGRVVRILEHAEAYAKFETGKYRYCIAGHVAEECALPVAA